MCWDVMGLKLLLGYGLWSDLIECFSFSFHFIFLLLFFSCLYFSLFIFYISRTNPDFLYRSAMQRGSVQAERASPRR